MHAKRTLTRSDVDRQHVTTDRVFPRNYVDEKCGLIDRRQVNDWSLGHSLPFFLHRCNIYTFSQYCDLPFRFILLFNFHQVCDTLVLDPVYHLIANTPSLLATSNSP